MNRTQKALPALLCLANVALAAIAFEKPDLLASYVPVVLLVNGIVAAVMMLSSGREVPDANPALQQLEGERDTLAQQRDALQTALQDAERDRQRLTNQQGVVQAELEQAKVELARAKSALRTHDETLTSVRRQLDDATGSQQNAEITLQSRSTELEQLRSWRSRAENEMNTLQQRLQDETTQRSRMDQERGAAVDRMRGVEARIGSLEQEVHHRSTLLQTVLDSLPDVVMVVSSDYRPTIFNAAAVQLLGVDVSDTNVLQALPKFGLYQKDRNTLMSPEALPLSSAMRGLPVEPVELFVRNSRRPAGVAMRLQVRGFGDGAARNVLLLLQEARPGTALPPPMSAPATAMLPSLPPSLQAPPPPSPTPARPAEPADGPPAAPKASPPSTGTALRVLLVEDSAVNQKLGVRVIEMTGHKATVAGSGLDALAAIEREEFDLVLMDLTMPGMGGIETTALIREQEVGVKKRVPIVAVTASSKEGSRERCLQWGMDGYIVKPLQPSKLEEVITTLFKSDGSSPESAVK